MDQTRRIVMDSNCWILPAEANLLPVYIELASLLGYSECVVVGFWYDARLMPAAFDEPVLPKPLSESAKLLKAHGIGFVSGVCLRFLML